MKTLSNQNIILLHVFKEMVKFPSTKFTYGIFVSLCHFKQNVLYNGRERIHVLHINLFLSVYASIFIKI